MLIFDDLQLYDSFCMYISLIYKLVGVSRYSQTMLKMPVNRHQTGLCVGRDRQKRMFSAEKYMEAGSLTLRPWQIRCEKEVKPG